MDHRLGAGVATRGLVDGPGAGGRQGLVDTRVTTTGRVGPRLGGSLGSGIPHRARVTRDGIALLVGVLGLDDAVAVAVAVVVDEGLVPAATVVSAHLVGPHLVGPHVVGSHVISTVIASTCGSRGGTIGTDGRAPGHGPGATAVAIEVAVGVIDAVAVLVGQDVGVLGIGLTQLGVVGLLVLLGDLRLTGGGLLLLLGLDAALLGLRGLAVGLRGLAVGLGLGRTGVGVAGLRRGLALAGLPLTLGGLLPQLLGLGSLALDALGLRAPGQCCDEPDDEQHQQDPDDDPDPGVHDPPP